MNDYSLYRKQLNSFTDQIEHTLTLCLEPQTLNLFLVLVIDSVSHHIYTLLFLGIQSV